MMKLSQQITAELAVRNQQEMLALMAAAPRMRMAEYLEAKLQAAGMTASAIGRMVGGADVAVHVVAHAAPERISDTLCVHDITFDITRVPGQSALHYDCCVGSHNVLLLVLPPVDSLLEQVA
jgi:hypothetical protein